MIKIQRWRPWTALPPSLGRTSVSKTQNHNHNHNLEDFIPCNDLLKSNVGTRFGEMSSPNNSTYPIDNNNSQQSLEQYQQQLHHPPHHHHHPNLNASFPNNKANNHNSNNNIEATRTLTDDYTDHYSVKWKNPPCYQRPSSSTSPPPPITTEQSHQYQQQQQYQQHPQISQGQYPQQQHIQGQPFQQPQQQQLDQTPQQAHAQPQQLLQPPKQLRQKAKQKAKKNSDSATGHVEFSNSEFDSMGDNPSRRRRTKGISDGDLKCSNCGVLETSLWRYNMDGSVVCNPCGLYQRRNKMPRPHVKLSKRRKSFVRKSANKDGAKVSVKDFTRQSFTHTNNKKSNSGSPAIYSSSNSHPDLIEHESE
eukprot:Awhi_evm1s8733